jgi:PAS domain S-box-containing protein
MASRQTAEEVYRDVLVSRQPRTFVSNAQSAGNDLSFEVNVYPSSQGISVIAHDITERKRSEEALRQSEERFRSMYENAGVGMELASPDGRLIMVNPSLCRLLGYKESELLIKTWQDITHPDDLASEFGLVEMLLSGDRASYEHEKRYVHRDGSVIWANATASSVKDSSGRHLYRIVVVRDITARKQAEEALRHEEERFRATFEQATVGMAHVSLDGRILMANDRLCEMIGYSRPELLARTLQDITHPDDREHQLSDESRLQSGDIQKYSIEKRYIRKNGQIVWIYLTVSPVRVTGEPHYYVAVVEDITARKKAEQALLYLSGRLIGAQEEERKRVARELHDVVGQDVAMLGIELGKAARGTSLSDVRNAINKLSANLQTITSDLQQLSHRLHPSTLDHLSLSLAIKEHCEALAAQHEDIEFTFNSINVPNSVSKDVALCLFRIVQEALGNVVKHSKARRARVQLVGSSQDVALSIQDDGDGFDLEAAKAKGRLGLVSMSERLRIIGGSISIYSRPSAGTRIEVRVPIRNAKAA